MLESLFLFKTNTRGKNLIYKTSARQLIINHFKQLHNFKMIQCKFAPDLLFEIHHKWLEFTV